MTRTCDGDAAEAKPCFDVKDVFHQVGGGQDDRIRDEAVLVPLDGTDHGGLGLGGLVMVDDTDTSQELVGNNTVVDTYL